MANHGRFRDRTGERYGGWTVLRFTGISKKWRSSMWLCRCDCGLEQECSLNLLRREGKCRECGLEGTVRKHGMTGTPTYQSWQKMLQRCYSQSAINYERYGGRGITVCRRWRYSFENFLADMGERPVNDGATRYSLGRIDNNRGYSPKNCRWENDYQQANNKRCTRLIKWNGRVQSLTEWAREFNLQRYFA
jgi:hypothetical protein